MQNVLTLVPVFKLMTVESATETKLVDVILYARKQQDVTAWMESNTLLRSELSYRHPEDGTPALVAACRRAMASVASSLLEVQVPVQDTNSMGDTALHWACLWSSEVPEMVEVVEKLLVAGADPSAVGDVGNTPLHLAATANNVMVCYSSAKTTPVVLCPLSSGISGNLRVTLVARCLQACAFPGRQ